MENFTTPRKILKSNYGATAESSLKCLNCKSIEELKDFFKSEMAVLSGQFKLVLEKVGQQKIQTAQLLRERSEAEGLSSLFPVASKDELKCLDLQIEQELFCENNEGAARVLGPKILFEIYFDG
ncbi:hypothetical protein ACLKA7_017680 [Drosophila subpalustris]